MTNEQKEKIVDILIEIHKKVDSLPSIEEKMKKYISTLRFYVDNDLIDFDIDFESEELEELITNNFLNIEIAKPQVFVGNGYHPWLEKACPNIVWNYKNRYFKYLLKKKHWIPQNVFSLDKMSDIILFFIMFSFLFIHKLICLVKLLFDITIINSPTSTD